MYIRTGRRNKRDPSCDFLKILRLSAVSRMSADSTTTESRDLSRRTFNTIYIQRRQTRLTSEFVVFLVEAPNFTRTSVPTSSTAPPDMKPSATSGRHLSKFEKTAENAALDDFASKFRVVRCFAWPNQLVGFLLVSYYQLLSQQLILNGTDFREILLVMS